MKIIIILIAFFLTSDIFAGGIGPELEWTKEFTFGGSDDNVSQLVIDNDHTMYINGWKDMGSFNYSSAIGKFNQHGDSIWKKVDTFPKSLPSLPFCVLENRVSYISSSSTNKYLVSRENGNGNLISTNPISFSMALARYGDSIIAVTEESNSRVLILDTSGGIGRQFLVGEHLMGWVDIKVIENSLWIFSNYYDGGYNILAAEYDISAGTQIWRQNILSAIQPRGNADSLGNAYLGVSKMGPNSTHIFKLVKIDSSGTVVWDKEWVPNQSEQANIDNYTNSVAASLKKGIVILAGNIEKDSILNTMKSVVHIYGRDVVNGDSVFSSRILINSGADDNLVNCVRFDGFGNMFVIGKYRDGTFNPRNTLYLRKYVVDTLTGITSQIQIATQFELSQNYPNPFNPTTKINFQIPDTKLVTLKVYDILGKEVATLVNEKLSAGSYEVDWNASDCPSGVYFYKLITNEFSDVKKMVLVK